MEWTTWGSPQRKGKWVQRGPGVCNERYKIARCGPRFPCCDFPLCSTHIDPQFTAVCEMKSLPEKGINVVSIFYIELEIGIRVCVWVLIV